MNLYKNGKNIYKASNNVTIIKNEKEVIIWKSDENIIIDKYLFKDRFEEFYNDMYSFVFGDDDE